MAGKQALRGADILKSYQQILDLSLLRKAGSDVINNALKILETKCTG